MKFVRRNQGKAPTLALTSMLDVIFLLLCFFVTISVFSQWESEITITLPSSTTAEQPRRLPGEIVVNLAMDGSIRVNGRPLSLTGLGSSLQRIAEYYPDQAIIIRADKAAKYDDLVKVIDTSRAAGIWNFSLATEGDRQ